MAVFITSNIFVVSQTAEGQNNEIIIRVGIWKNPSDNGTYDYDDYVTYSPVLPYTWEVGDQTYRIKPINITVSNFPTLLNPNNEDKVNVLLIDGIEGPILYTWALFPTLTARRQAKFKSFIEDGGGYVGFCGGSELPLKFHEEQSSIVEYCYNENSFLKENYDSKVVVNSKDNSGIPIIDQYSQVLNLDFRTWKPFQFLRYWLSGGNPENIGALAWAWETGNYPVYAVPMNLKITEEGKEHPVLSDYHSDSIYIGWAGGPAIYFEKNHDNPNILNLAYFEDDKSEDENTRIHAWSWRPTERFELLKLIRNFLEILFCEDDDGNQESKAISKGDILLNLFYNLRWWRGWVYDESEYGKLDDGVEPDIYHSSLATIEKYGDNEGRLFLCSCHPLLSIRIEKSPFSTIEKYPTHQSQIIRFEVGRKHAENGGNLYDKRIKKSGIEYPSYQT